MLLQALGRDMMKLMEFGLCSKTRLADSGFDFVAEGR